MKFSEFIQSRIDEKKLNIPAKIKYYSMSNSNNIPGIGGTYLDMNIDGVDFGIVIAAFSDKFSASITPNIPGDWRRLSSKDLETYAKYFGSKKHESTDPLFKGMLSNGLDLRFKNEKELVKFIKDYVENPARVFDDILSSKEKVPEVLRTILFKNVKLTPFEKKLTKSTPIQKVMLLIKQYKHKIDPNFRIQYIKDGSTNICSIVSPRYYWYIDVKADDKRIKQALGRVHIELDNFTRRGEDSISDFVASEGILNKRDQKLFVQWLLYIVEH